ncbi:hypothetical protein C3747_64g101 [Trypanosoma cruzi]|uniref:Hikeshi-like C-terminal domain-containing protein n=2 Tax=Trypanosoma cruzi TaxID=5693 RepID=Q4CW49_TRYCC|nr:hypothetical protein, conserved [Trypanosoma cruzi]XP_814102.1 hypothetical protein, conserved [Trypanosoma cruzi]EAN84500.1 hypothetical protein, conserved [Trypanosoma cruzi]EAN92251.1 hypothetical protein, conserved [Trypanosoma cruzi]PWV08719.1 hypothetical protein C3747_87g72 [Trypanosoma cruzi]PWV10939.1 hypothetical protein C3747_64g101 [Trypanosoma cruzi]RNC48517.1 hypothetical protein TcCL_NonESM01558 [Trypanosoma cruzi]|eukprot:XP_806351.1 hypothetical protein [Trypanosoma cruzi strain CL Brener]
MAVAPNVLPPFAAILPGLPLVTEFNCLDGVRWIAPLGNAPESIVVFLTSPAPLAPGICLGIYLAREDDGAFLYVGHLSNMRPSTILRVPPVLLNVDFPVRLLIGISQEKEEDVANLGATQEQPLQQEQAATRLAMAERIVEDLFNFVMSYGRVLSADPTDAQSEETVYLPASFVSRWRERVLTKMRKDASFWN